MVMSSGLQDRILWKKDPGIKSLSYNSVPLGPFRMGW